MLIESSVTRPTSNSVWWLCADLCRYSVWSSRSWQEGRIVPSGRIGFPDIYSLPAQSAEFFKRGKHMSSDPARKQRGLRRLISWLPNCVNRFDFASVSALRQAVRSHLASMFCAVIFAPPCKASCVRSWQWAPAGAWNPWPSLCWSISRTVTLFCCKVLMEHCGDSVCHDQVHCNVRASQGINLSMNHVRPCRGKE